MSLDDDTTDDGVPEMDTFQQLIDTDVDGLLDMPHKPTKVTSNDRLERAFLEIVEFRRTHGRLPSPSTREISERKLGARLDGILADDTKIKALTHLDELGLLTAPEAPGSIDELLDDDPLGLLADEHLHVPLSAMSSEDPPNLAAHRHGPEPIVDGSAEGEHGHCRSVGRAQDQSAVVEDLERDLGSISIQRRGIDASIVVIELARLLRDENRRRLRQVTVQKFVELVPYVEPGQHRRDEPDDGDEPDHHDQETSLQRTGSTHHVEGESRATM